MMISFEEVKKLSKEEYIEYLKDKYEVNTVTENDRITTGDGNNHHYTWERIYHFSCGNCRNWWSMQLQKIVTNGILVR